MIFLCLYLLQSCSKTITRHLKLYMQEPIGDTREEVSRILKNTWTTIESLVPAPSLASVREELKSATSLLVLATLRKSASSDDNSKSIVEGMFQAADANGDGELSFVEWYDWLNGPISEVSHIPSESSFVLPQSQASTTEGEKPIIQSLKQVFSHSLFALQVLSRSHNDNSIEYVSAFVSGGIMSGVLDSAICRSMLSRLSPKTTELISFSLSVESASLPIALKPQSKRHAVVVDNKDSKSPFDPASIEGDGKDLIETIDLATVQPLTAPSIYDEDSSPPPLLSTLIESNENENTETSLSIEKSFETGLSRTNVFGEGVENDVDVVIQRAEVLAQEITQLRSIIKDLDDKQAAAMRLLMLREYGKRDDVLRLAMAIRATRLQHAHRLPIFARHQLAVDTLQLWAPLSFHLGTAGYLSELEVHSYVLLFPRSFGAFIDWYGAYRPLAKIAVELFRQDIESLLKSTPGVSESIRKVTIQSRLKTPASAFKKMVKGVKSHHQLLDLAGVRVIVDEAGDVADISMELKAVQLALEVVTAMPNWKEEKARFKDYISSPKPSGYQSFHLSLRHKTQGLTLEVQIRSRRMHNIAEYGSASHKNYKALMLPEKSATAADSSIS